MLKIIKFSFVTIYMFHGKTSWNSFKDNSCSEENVFFEIWSCSIFSSKRLEFSNLDLLDASNVGRGTITLDQCAGKSGHILGKASSFNRRLDNFGLIEFLRLELESVYNISWHKMSFTQKDICFFVWIPIITRYTCNPLSPMFGISRETK